MLSRNPIITIPIFPLNLVLFPNSDLPLHIFEDRYKQMVHFCVQNKQPVRIALLKEAKEVGEYATPYNVGTLGYITSTNQNPDGTIEIVVTGKSKFRISELLYDKPYLSATVETIEPSFDNLDRSALEPVKTSIQLLNKLIDQSYGGWARSYFVENDPQSLIYQGIDLVLQNLSVPNTVKQNLLEGETFERQSKLLLTIIDESVKLFQAEADKNQPYSGFSKN